jgi:hypothetical protein
MGDNREFVEMSETVGLSIDRLCDSKIDEAQPTHFTREEIMSVGPVARVVRSDFFQCECLDLVGIGKDVVEYVASF